MLWQCDHCREIKWLTSFKGGACQPRYQPEKPVAPPHQRAFTATDKGMRWNCTYCGAEAKTAELLDMVACNPLEETRIHTGPASPILVIIESPYAGDVDRNIQYARAALRDSVVRREAPLASHLLFTQEGVLRDGVPEERQLGINAGLAWGRVADLTAVYYDLGISEGMRYGINKAIAESRRVEFRKVPEWK